jgi:hypothetical protein
MSRRVTVAFLAVFLGGCATPKEINGRKVLRTLWQDGRIVYVVEEDKVAMEKATREASEASRGIILQPLKQSPAK